MKRIVREAYTAAYDKAMVVVVGTELQYERRESPWSGWLWCTDNTGFQAWVPEAWTQVSEFTCTMRRDYTSRELTVTKGDLVEVILEESGWAYARATDNSEGWVPLDNLAPSAVRYQGATA